MSQGLPPSIASPPLLQAVADAALLISTLWLSYIFATAYLMVAVGGVTHLDLFMENPVDLPFLGAKIPLRGFFVLGPLLFLVVHAYVLLLEGMLAGKVAALGKLTLQQRLQLPLNPFVQQLAGPKDGRCKLRGALLQMITVISLAVAPVGLLVFFLIRFLPFHDETISWLQRLVILADLALLWQLWPITAAGSARAMRISVALALLLLILAAPVFPGEWLARQLPSPFGVRETLYAGSPNPQGTSLNSFWADRLVVPDADLPAASGRDAPAKIAAEKVTHSFHDRNLTYALLTGAHLQRADFTGADLRQAQLTRARLQGAWFGGAKLDGAAAQEAQMQGASFYNASLIGANLQGARLDGAALVMAKLNNVEATDTHFPGASLNGADVTGADFTGADLRAADLQTKLQNRLIVAGAKGAGAVGVDPRLVKDMAGANNDPPWAEIACTAEGAPYVAMRYAELLATRAVDIAASAKDPLLTKLGPPSIPHELIGQECAAAEALPDETRMVLTQFSGPDHAERPTARQTSSLDALPNRKDQKRRLLASPGTGAPANRTASLAAKN